MSIDRPCFLFISYFSKILPLSHSNPSLSAMTTLHNLTSYPSKESLPDLASSFSQLMKANHGAASVGSRCGSRCSSSSMVPDSSEKSCKHHPKPPLHPGAARATMSLDFGFPIIEFQSPAGSLPMPKHSHRRQRRGSKHSVSKQLSRSKTVKSFLNLLEPTE